MLHRVLIVGSDAAELLRRLKEHKESLERSNARAEAPTGVFRDYPLFREDAYNSCTIELSPVSLSFELPSSIYTMTGIPVLGTPDAEALSPALRERIQALSTMDSNSSVREERFRALIERARVAELVQEEQVYGFTVVCGKIDTVGAELTYNSRIDGKLLTCPSDTSPSMVVDMLQTILSPEENMGPVSAERRRWSPEPEAAAGAGSAARATTPELERLSTGRSSTSTGSDEGADDFAVPVRSPAMPRDARRPNPAPQEASQRTSVFSGLAALFGRSASAASSASRPAGPSRGLGGGDAAAGKPAEKLTSFVKTPRQ